MDKFDAYIEELLNRSFLSKQKKKELTEEIKDHLTLSKAELLSEGLTEEEAEQQAMERFGETAKLSRSFQRVFTPLRFGREIMSRHKIAKEAFKWAVSVAGAFLVAISVRSYAFAAAEVEQCSMQNTLYEGQRLIESKLDYFFGTPQRGDIVIIDQSADQKNALKTFLSNTDEFFRKFNQKDDEKVRLVKRVIGLPGDLLDIKDGKVFINGKEIEEPYIKGTTIKKGFGIPVAIPEHKYFVMGDNREHSFDSREFGLIDISQIEGKAVIRVWPVNKIGSLDK